MNNITELPAYVFKNFPYLEELWVPFFSCVNDAFTLHNDSRARLYDMHLDIWVCTAKHTVWVHSMPFFPAEEDKRSITWGYESLSVHELNKGSSKRCSKAQLKKVRWDNMYWSSSHVTSCVDFFFLLLRDYQGGNSTSMLWGFVEWRTSNLSGCLLFLHSLNSPLSGSALLGVRDKICLPDIR